MADDFGDTSLPVTDTQADLTERAREIVAGSYYNPDSQYGQYWIKLIAAALQSEREAAAAEAKIIIWILSSSYFFF